MAAKSRESVQPGVTLSPVERVQPYVTLSTSMLGILGVFLGAFVPIIHWLDSDKTTYWIIAALIIFSVFGYFLPKLFSHGYSKRFLYCFVPFAVFWAFLPIFLCSTVFFVGDASKDCFCNKYEPVPIRIVKFNDVVRVSNPDQIRKLLDQTKSAVVAYPEFQHSSDVERLLEKLEADSANTKLVGFANEWRDYENETATALMRMLAEFSSRPLAPSKYSEDYDKRIAFQLRSKPNQVVVVDDAKAYIDSLLERGVAYKPMVDNAIVTSAQKMLSLRFMKLYSRISRIKDLGENIASGLDRDFLRFVAAIPPHDSIVKLVGYKEATGGYIKFETGNPPIYASSSYSRFLVPKSVVNRNEVLERMRIGPWPIGKPRMFFSEDWWLQHATWQMLGRERGSYLDNLAIRINDFNVIGPP